MCGGMFLRLDELQELNLSAASLRKEASLWFWDRFQFRKSIFRPILKILIEHSFVGAFG